MFTFGIAANTFALTHVVYPDQTKGWIDASNSGGTINYAIGTAPESFGYGSLRFKTDATNTSSAIYGQAVNQSLSSITTLSYYTSQAQASASGGSAAMFVSLDINNDGVLDTNLIYEPYLQSSHDPNSNPVVANDWQQWEASEGVFWSSAAYSGNLNLVAGAENSPFYTLDQIREAYPNALVEVFGVSVGTNNPNYTIFVDGITVNESVYDFEGLSTPTAKDQCRQEGWTTFSRSDGTSIFTNQGSCIAFVQSSINSVHHR
jgi:hypothetical protein